MLMHDAEQFVLDAVKLFVAADRHHLFDDLVRPVKARVVCQFPKLPEPVVDHLIVDPAQDRRTAFPNT